MAAIVRAVVASDGREEVGGVRRCEVNGKAIGHHASMLSIA